LTLPSSLVGQQVTLTLSFSNGNVTADDDNGDNGGQGGNGGSGGGGSGGGHDD